MTRSTNLTLGLTLVLAGACDGGTRPGTPFVRDAGRDAETSMDGATDGATSDLDAQAGELDAPTDDDAPTTQDDAGGDAWVDPEACVGSDLCPCTRPPGDCETSADCGPAELCLPQVCGEGRCEPAGAPCSAPGDCSTGATCTAGVCQRSDSTCVDSRDCPIGYECEGPSGSRACVNRRVPCVEPDACPMGTACVQPLATATGYCVRLGRPCETSAACSYIEGAGTCLDIDLDGDTECGLSGRCTNVDECQIDADATCGVHPVGRLLDCVRLGYCRTTADCHGGTQCVDLSGEGLHECVESGAGGCSSDADCEVGQMCGSSPSGGSPHCFPASP
jgi:hypothetical protein